MQALCQERGMDLIPTPWRGRSESSGLDKPRRYVSSACRKHIGGAEAGAVGRVEKDGIAIEVRHLIFAQAFFRLARDLGHRSARSRFYSVRRPRVLSSLDLGAGMVCRQG